MAFSRIQAARTARSVALGLLSLSGLGTALAGCSDDGHAKAPAAAAGRAGGSGRAGSSSSSPTAGGSENGGALGEDGGAAAGNAGGGAPSLGGAGDTTVGPPNVGGDPGLTLDDCPSDALAAPPNLPGVCSPTQRWTSDAAVPVTHGAAPSFVAITPSELTLLWSEAPSSVAVYFVADRESAAEPFGEPQELPFGRALGLSPDGLRLTLVADDGSLAEATRSARGESFGNPEAGAYEELDADRALRQLTLADVAIAGDDRTLFYSARSLNGETPYPIRLSRRAGGEAWPVGQALETCELKAYGAFGPRPTGVSADGLTLFYFDGARAKTRAALRASVAADFSWFADLPDMATPQPNAGCDHLYFSPLGRDPGLLVATRAP